MWSHDKITSLSIKYKSTRAEENSGRLKKKKNTLSKHFIFEAMAPLLLRGHLRAAALGKKRMKSKAKNGRRGMSDMQESFKRLKSEMDEISEEQKNIREGQRQVKEKFEAVEAECEELKRETRLIIQQSARTQIKLALMFRILKAREAGDFNTAASLTEMLRVIVGREKEEKEDDC